jgi:hypothetical protein
MIASEASETAGPSTFNARPKGKKTLMRRLKIISGIVVTLVVGWFIFATVMIYIPPQGDVEAETDAVVSLSPPPYRLPLAQELYANDRADRLAISYVPVDPRHFNAEWVAAWEPAENYCEEGTAQADEHISCFTPEEVSTRGEAYAVRELAEVESWDSITVVTSRHHTFRVRYIFEQCVGDVVDVNVVFPEPDPYIEKSKENWGWYLLYENAAFFKAIYETTVGC